MSFPQGINFRQTVGFATDGANQACQQEPSGGYTDYPWTTAQGTTVGFETSPAGCLCRNRNAGNDVRLAGMGSNGGSGTWDYRIDLSAVGVYNIGIAMGEASYAGPTNCEIFDTSTSLGVICSGSTSAAQRFKDATNTEYTNLTWPASQTLISKTFSTTICRFRIGSAGTSINPVAHIYMETGGPNNVIYYLKA